MDKSQECNFQGTVAWVLTNVYSCVTINDPTSDQKYRTFLLPEKVRLYLFVVNTSTLSPAPGNQWSAFYYYVLVLPFLEFHTNVIMWYVCFYIWLMLLSIMTFNHVVVSVVHCFLLVSRVLLYGCTTTVYVFNCWEIPGFFPVFDHDK